MELFAEQGYETASMLGIAARAQLSKSVIYDHFSSKADLHRALLEREADALLSDLARAVPPPDASTPRERLRSGIEAFFRYAEDRPVAWRLLIRDPPADPELAAAHYQIPSLWIVNNNRSYFNDEDHQDRVARFRDRPPENRWLAQRMERPEVDFGGIARTFGLYGEGPIKSAAELAPALRRALEAVKGGQLALLDVWTENRTQG